MKERATFVKDIYTQFFGLKHLHAYDEKAVKKSLTKKQLPSHDRTFRKKLNTIEF